MFWGVISQHNSIIIYFDAHTVSDWATGNQLALASAPFYMPLCFFEPRPQEQSFLQGAAEVWVPGAPGAMCRCYSLAPSRDPARERVCLCVRASINITYTHWYMRNLYTHLHLYFCV